MGETWREQHTPRCWVPPEGSNEMADVHDIRDALPTGRSLRASDLAAQVNLELERQRGWYQRADGYYGPAPVAGAVAAQPSVAPSDTDRMDTFHNVPLNARPTIV